MRNWGFSLLPIIAEIGYEYLYIKEVYAPLNLNPTRILSAGWTGPIIFYSVKWRALSNFGIVYLNAIKVLVSVLPYCTTSTVIQSNFQVSIDKWQDQESLKGDCRRKAQLHNPMKHTQATTNSQCPTHQTPPFKIVYILMVTTYPDSQLEHLASTGLRALRAQFSQDDINIYTQYKSKLPNVSTLLWEDTYLVADIISKFNPHILFILEIESGPC